MTKAILVLNEMPKGCSECPLFNSDFYTCQLVFDELYEEARKGIRHDNCPLKEMPQKKDMYWKDYMQPIDKSEEQTNIFNKGYNHCLKEILGEEE